eukprot:1157351-Pelagomonas_calceolata.AAC.3
MTGPDEHAFAHLLASSTNDGAGDHASNPLACKQPIITPPHTHFQTAPMIGLMTTPPPTYLQAAPMMGLMITPPPTPTRLPMAPANPPTPEDSMRAFCSTEGSTLERPVVERQGRLAALSNLPSAVARYLPDNFCNSKVHHQQAWNGDSEREQGAISRSTPLPSVVSIVC